MSSYAWDAIGNCLDESRAYEVGGRTHKRSNSYKNSWNVTIYKI